MEFKCRKTRVEGDDSYTVLETSDILLKEHVLGNAVPGAVGVYTTMSLSPDSTTVDRKQDHVELHTARLVRCIASVLGMDISEPTKMEFYTDVRYYVNTCVDAACQVISDAPEYMIVIVFWVLSGQERATLGIEKLLMYVKEYAPRLLDAPKMAYILGPPRMNPNVKDVMWMRDREYLERLAPREATEVLLCSKRGDLLEGLVTNIFVIVDVGDGERVVQTAPVERGVLWGTMREKVIDACKYLDIPVEFTCPSMASHHTWKEAFLTNSMRGVCPLDGITCSKENVWGLPEWHITFDTSHISTRIAKYLSEQQHV